MAIRSRQAAPSGKGTQTQADGAARMARRAGWGIGDQILNSGSNFAMGIVVARSFPLDDFGVYALVFAAYALGLGVSRALSTEPYAVTHSAAGERSSRRAAKAALGTAVVAGIAGGMLAAAIGLSLNGETTWTVLALAVSFPGLMLQDAWRQVFFSSGRGQKAFMNDLAWIIFMIPGFVVVFLSGAPTMAGIVLAWGLAGTAAGIMGMIQGRLLPSPQRTGLWLTDQRALWSRFLGENLAVNGSQQILFSAIAGIAGMAALGQIKLVQVALGPILVLSQGISVIAVPEAARALKRGKRAISRVRIAASAVVAGGAAAWGIALFVLPQQWTGFIVGGHWVSAAVLVLPLTLVQVFNGLRTGDAMMLRAMRQAHRGFLTRAATSTSLALGGVIGACLGSATGAAWGMAIASAASSWLWAIQYRRGSAVHAAAQLSSTINVKGGPA